MLLLYCAALLLFKNFIYANEWNHNAYLDANDRYHISWKYDDQKEMITFLAEVKTKGWIGFGLSPNGGMKGSDIIIAWITDDGITYFHV